MQDGQILPGIHTALHFIKVYLEYICAGCALFGAFASFVAIRQFRRANQMSARVLELAEQKPLIRLSIFGLDEVKNIVVAAPIKEDRHLALPLTFKLTNDGEKTATDLQLTLRMSRFLSGKKYESSHDKRATITRVDSENFSTFIFDLPNLNPKDSCISGVDVLMPHSSTIKVAERGFRIEARLTYVISATIASRDTPTDATRFVVEFINTNDSNAATVLKAMNERTIKRTTPHIPFFHRILRKPTSPVTAIALVDFSENDLKNIWSNSPVDRVTDPKVHVVRGAKTNDDGSFFLPAIGVFPKESSISGLSMPKPK